MPLIKEAENAMTPWSLRRVLPWTGRAERSAYPLVILSSPLRGPRKVPLRVLFLAEGQGQLRQRVRA